MNKLLTLVTVGFRSRALLRAALVATLGLLLWTTAQAEGSRSLYPANYLTTTSPLNQSSGDRAFIEWRTSTYYGEPFRRTLLYVYAEAGEVLLLGSSNQGEASGDIFVYPPGVVTGTKAAETVPAPTASTFRCSSQTGSPRPGYIQNRVRELAGPRSVNGANNTSGYRPCVYNVSTTGIHNVVITGTAGFSTDNNEAPNGIVFAPTSTTTFETRGGAVAAWDVTVRSNDPASTTNRNGRVFTYAIGASMGDSNRNLFSTIFSVTTDGFRYRTYLRGFDPFGFILLGNALGFLDPDGVTPIYHDALDDNNQLTSIEGGVTVARAEYPIFFEPPANNTLNGINGLGIPLTTLAPEVRNLAFAAPSGGNTTSVSAGGTFSYDAVNIGAHNYELVISRDGVDFDPTTPTNRVLRGRFSSGGSKTISWNGRDNNGVNFPVGENYPARIRVHAGEYHFPYGDVENAPNGGPTYTLLNPPGGVCPTFGSVTSCTTGFYDDRAYRLTDGTLIPLGGALNVNDALAGAPTIPYSGPNGFNTDSNQRSFSGFGNTKGLDLWTYYPSNAETVQFNIIDPFLLTKSVRNLRTGASSTTGVSGQPGDTLEYCISYNNTGGDVNTVVVEDPIPAFTDPVTSVADYSNDAIRYIPGGGSTQTFSAATDGDEGEIASNQVTVRIAQILANATGEICFRVTIQ